MPWRGPKEDGITYSLLTRFFAEDPYRLYLYFMEGLEEYRDEGDNLAYGSIAHVGLEELIKIPYTKEEFTPEDWEQIFEAMMEVLNNEYPSCPPSFKHSVKQMISLYNDSFKEEYGQFVTEIEFKVPHVTSHGHEITLRGKIDALQILKGDLRPECKFGEYEFKQLPRGFVPGHVLGEHKFKGRFDPLKLKHEIAIDHQVSIYSFVAGTDLVIYDNIRIPDVQYSLPRKRQYQTTKSYIEELFTKTKWGDFPVAEKRHLWLNQQHIPIDPEVIKRNFAFSIEPAIDWICHLWDLWQDSNFDPENPTHYNKDFFRKPIRLFDPAVTASWEGNYYGLYTDQINKEDLIPVKSYYAELSND